MNLNRIISEPLFKHYSTLFCIFNLTDPIMLKLISFISVLFLIGCRYDNEETILAAFDIKYTLEGMYICQHYHYYWDFYNDIMVNDSIGVDTIVITALDDEKEILFEIDDYVSSTYVSYDSFSNTWSAPLTPYGHRVVIFYVPDSLYYSYCAGMGPNCEHYFGKKIE